MSKKLKYQTAQHRHQTARTGQTEHLLPLLLSMLNQRETRAELPNLDPQRAIELYEDYRKGIMADVQLAFDEMESYDDDLATVVDKRQRALEQMPWQVEIDSAAVGDDATRTALAEEQQAYLQQRFNAIENLEEAITYLGMADFHGVAALELTGNSERARWEVIEPWLLARPARRGPWYYNPEASRSYTEVEELDPGKVIIREARPITLVCMWLVVAKHHAIHGWDEFLEVFGNPSIFAELPPGTSEETARVLDEMVKRIVSDGRGTVPTGTKFTTVETGQNNCAAFADRARWCKEAIITVATGGQLTVLAEPGSGTLAGGAHSDSFESLCAGTAAAISAVINKQWVRRILAEKWPQQPALAKFTLAPEPADERAAMADLLGKLTAAGYELETDEAASDLVTLPLKKTQAAMPGMPQPMQPITNRAGCHRPNHENGCSCVEGTPADADPETAKLPRPQEEPDEGVPYDEQEDPYADNPGWDEEEEEPLENRKDNAAAAHSVGFLAARDRTKHPANTPTRPKREHPQGDSPLTEAELAAFHALGRPNMERMNQRRQEVQTALMRAADLEDAEEEEIIENGNLRGRAKNPLTCPRCNPSRKGITRGGDGTGAKSSFVPPNERKEAAENPQNTPQMRNERRSKARKGFEAALRGESADIGKRGENRLLIAPGQPGDGPPDWESGEGALHIRAKHPEMTTDKIADIIADGEQGYSVRDGEKRLTFTLGKQSVVFRPTKEENTYTLMTAYKDWRL